MARQNPATDRPGAEQAEQKETERKRPRDGDAWADEAAKARTADDPRAVAPHDRLGLPSTGDTR